MTSPLSDEQGTFKTASTVHKQNDNLHPRQLSGDEQQTSSILASYSNNSKANLFMSATIVIKSTIGAGIISLPYTIDQLGYVLSLISFFVFFALNQFCSVLLLKSKNLSRHSNFSTILYYIWHSDVSKMVGNIIILVDNLGACILQFILIKASIRHIAEEVTGDLSVTDNWYLSKWFIVLVVGLIEFPFVLVKKIERLRIFSFIGVGGIIIFGVGVIIEYIIRRADGFQGMPMEPFPRDWFKAASAVANIIFAYNFQFNFFPIFKGLKDPSDSKMAKATLFGLIGCAIPYLTVGFIGYSLIGSQDKANFLQSMKYGQTTTVLYFIINASYLFSILFAIILVFFGARNNFISLFNLIRKRAHKPKDNQEDEDGEYAVLIDKTQRKSQADREYLLFTILLFAIMVITSIFLDNIQLVFNFLGAVCESLLMLFLPALFYVMLIRKEEQPKTISFFVAMAILIIMIPLCLFSVVASYIMG